MLAGVILAGGKSSRMGQDKSLLLMPNSQQSLLEHCHQTLALVCDEKVFISGAQHNLGIADIIPNCGPLSGLHASIVHIKKYHEYIDEVLVVPVDMPNLDVDDFALLVERGRNTASLCAFSNSFLPLYIPLSVHVIQYLDTIFKQGANEVDGQAKQRQYSIKRMLKSLHSLEVTPLKYTQVDNINTPEQWQKHCSELSILN